MISKKSHLAMLLALIIICFLVELMAGWFTNQSVHTWYPKLIKPAWTPPGFVFGPVWTILYLLMAFAMWLVWKTPSDKPKSVAYFFFWGQLFLNFIWSFLFFSLQSPVLGLIDISLLLIFILGTIVSFYWTRPLAAYLLIPYLLWASYAWALNYAIWSLN